MKGDGWEVYSVGVLFLILEGCMCVFEVLGFERELIEDVDVLLIRFCVCEGVVELLLNEVKRWMEILDEIIAYGLWSNLLFIILCIIFLFSVLLWLSNWSLWLLFCIICLLIIFFFRDGVFVGFFVFEMTREYLVLFVFF